MNENVPNLDNIAPMYWFKSITNCLFQWHKRNVHWTWTACCFTCHMNWIIFHRTPSGTWLEAREAECSAGLQAFGGHIPVTNDFIICWDMWHDRPGKFVLNLLNVLTLCCRNCLLRPVIQDAVPLWVSAHFVSMKRTIGY